MGTTIERAEAVLAKKWVGVRARVSTIVKWLALGSWKLPSPAWSRKRRVCKPRLEANDD